MLASFFIGSKIGFQKIREKEQFENSEHDKKFYQYNQPYLPAPASQILKSVDIKFPDSQKDILIFPRHCGIKIAILKILPSGFYYLDCLQH